MTVEAEDFDRGVFISWPVGHADDHFTQTL
jgi:hypothetical protein